jgi:hypothetical protein
VDERESKAQRAWLGNIRLNCTAANSLELEIVGINYGFLRADFERTHVSDPDGYVAQLPACSVEMISQRLLGD